MGKPINIFSESGITQIEVLTRHHFSSKLQRMSCVIKSMTSGKHYSVLKGSPEAVGRLLATKPVGYDDKAAYLSKEGYRVIALALKPLGSREEVKAAQDSRSCCENDMRFAGFIAFTCRVRKDTAAVLLRLKEGGMSIAMVTGDALLTAIHVAKEVNIIEPTGKIVENDYLALEQNEEIRKLIQEKRQGGAVKKETNKKKTFQTYPYVRTIRWGTILGMLRKHRQGYRLQCVPDSDFIQGL